MRTLAVPLIAVLAAALVFNPAPTLAQSPGGEAQAEIQPGSNWPRLIEIAFEGSDGFKLTGELMLPVSEQGARVPAMLLLPGSGPTDRNGNQPPALNTDLLKQIAERLAESGVATFRFDKRAVARYQSQWPISDPEAMNEFFAFGHFVADATAALRILRERDEIDPERIGIIGHSEGGLIALSIGSRLRGTEAAPRTLVLLATAGRTLDVVFREQITRQLGGADAPGADQFLAKLDEAVDALKAREPLPDGLPAPLPGLFNPTTHNIWHAYFTIDPKDVAESVEGDVLVLQGGGDVQVSASRDASRLLKALAARDSGAVSVVIVPGVSHNLKPLKGPGDPGFAGPVAQEALGAIVEWSRARLIDSEQ
jgi:alpha-beta hydrolase superfamily lysophospholipase